MTQSKTKLPDPAGAPPIVTGVQDLLAIGAALAAPIVHPSVDTPFAVVPEGYTIESLEPLLKRPVLMRGQVLFLDIPSLCAFVVTFQTPATRVFVSRERIEAVLDYHLPREPYWCAFRCFMALHYSDEFFDWTNPANPKDMARFGQRDFAEFIEEHRQDVIDPQAADILELCHDLQATQTAKFRSGVRLENGDFRLELQQDTVTNVEVPAKFTISIPVYEGAAPTDIEVRLRYRASAGDGLSFSFWIPGLQRIVKDQLKAMATLVAETTKVPVHMGEHIEARGPVQALPQSAGGLAQVIPVMAANRAQASMQALGGYGSSRLTP